MGSDVACRSRRYTYSRNKDNLLGEVNYFSNNSNGLARALDNNDLKSEFAHSIIEAPHRLNVSGIYELPFGKGKKYLDTGGPADWFLGGWQISAIGSYQSGFPVVIVQDNNNSGLFGSFQRPNLVAGQDPKSSGSTREFGADIRRAYNLRIPSDRHRAGELNFDAARTAGPSGGGTGLASFLLGDVSRFERYVSTITDAEERQNRWFFYGQDTWKVTKKLTVNYGVRWELYRPQTVTGSGKGGFVDINTGEALIAGSQGVGLDLNQEGAFTTVSPRIGIAYRVTDKTVVRMGFGRGFDIGVFGSVFGHNVTQNLPVLGIQSNQPAQNYLSVFTLAQGPQPLDPKTILDGQPKGPNGRPILPNGVTAFIDLRHRNCANRQDSNNEFGAEPKLPLKHCDSKRLCSLWPDAAKLMSR
ncbi:MAG: TonB-dependent receptor domain-containing protein [Blastocatellia bacterium]